MQNKHLKKKKLTIHFFVVNSVEDIQVEACYIVKVNCFTITFFRFNWFHHLAKSVVSYCKVNFVVKIKQLLCNCHIFSVFEVELVASVIEISKNIFSSKKYGLSGKETRKKKKKQKKGK